MTRLIKSLRTELSERLLLLAYRMAPALYEETFILQRHVNDYFAEVTELDRHLAP